MCVLILVCISEWPDVYIKHTLEIVQQNGKENKHKSAWKMVQRAKDSPCKHEGWSLVPQNLHRPWAGSAVPLFSQHFEAETGNV